MSTFKRVISIGVAAVLMGMVALNATAQDVKQLQNFRPYDKGGINVFEPIQKDTVPYEGFDVEWGAAFTQQLQSLSHSTDGVDDQGDPIQLPDIGTGFNLATANLYLDAQLAKGIRVNLTTYLSSRHHAEAWVKGGYLMVDELPMFNSDAIDNLMEYLSLRVGHMEINYGDAHFRRTDNANAAHNPFVGNYILDSFNTEVGGELYFYNNGLLAMIAASNGELHPSVTNTEYKSPSIYGKLGYDKQFNEDLRFRLTGSFYTTSSSAAGHLYSGDRAGARYYNILSGGFRTPRVTPGLSNEIHSVMINPFIKYKGLELFGTYEKASGNARITQGFAPTDQVGPDKEWSQVAVDLLYRFLPDEQAFLGARYNAVTGEPAGGSNEVTVDRIQIGGGWFMTDNILLKAEYVTQSYSDYPNTSIYNGAEFNGIMFEGTIAW